MTHLQRIKAVLIGLCATLLLTTGAMVVVAPAAQATPALTTDHVIACIRTAMAAQAGFLKESTSSLRGGGGSARWNSQMTRGRTMNSASMSPPITW
jgi:hypothetical protein